MNKWKQSRALVFLLWAVSLSILPAGRLLANQIDGVRVWLSPDSTRVVFDLATTPNYRYFSLAEPDRLVIDFKQTSLKTKVGKVNNSSKLLKKIRSSTQADGKMRVVLDLNKKIKPVIFPLTPTGQYGHRLVVDLYDTGVKKAQKVRLNEKAKEKRDILVAIDAGHGGEDPGSVGSRGTYEKRVTLEIAKRLANLIKTEKGMKAKLVRTGDYYLGLNRRSEIARLAGADILISIHADAFSMPQPRGASVWVLSSKRANTEIGRWLEKHEKHSELLGGAADIIQDTTNERYLTQTILDMQMNHSRTVGYGVSIEILSELGRVTKLHKKQPESASLAVLKSPDIPSLLVETGFMSNPGEEKQLKTSSHQNKLAKAIFKGLKHYFRNNPPQGTLYASLNSQRTHKVRSGDSLSVLALRYNTSVTQLKKTNRLKGDVLQVGQVLTIPSS